MKIATNGSITANTVNIERNRHIATFDTIGKEYSVSFDFIPTKLEKGWHNVYHMTKKDTDCGRGCSDEGWRLPGIWFRRENEVSYIYVGSSVNGEGDFSYNEPEPSIQIGKAVNVLVQQKYVKWLYQCEW